jgi:protein-disulfide isomerase
MKHKTVAMLVAAALAVGCSNQAAPATTTPAGKAGSVEERLARLEAAYARNAEALAFLQKVYDQQKAQQAEQEDEEPADDAVFAVDVADDVKAGQVEGPAAAPVTIVKAFDFLCPYCYRAVDTLHDLVKDNPGKVRIVYTNLVVHPPARTAHLASCAAAKQGKYREFKDAYWEKGFAPYAQSQGKDSSTVSEDAIVAIAKGVGLDTKKLKADMASPDCEQRLANDMAQLQKFHVSATPTFFVNGKMITGALPKEDFQKLIDEQLKLVAASGVPAADYYDKVVLTKGEKQFRSRHDAKPTK